MLTWLFGPIQGNTVHIHTHDRATGQLDLKNARVRWFLSINNKTIPDVIKSTGTTTYRSITVDGEEIEFSGGFTDLHTHSYESILKGEGFSVSDAASSIQIVHKIRNEKPIGLRGNFHPLADLPLASHPFERKKLEIEKLRN